MNIAISAGRSPQMVEVSILNVEADNSAIEQGEKGKRGGGGRDGRPHPGGGGGRERNNTGCIGGAGRVRFNWFGLLGLTALATLRRSYRGQWRSQVFLLVVVRTPPPRQ